MKKTLACLLALVMVVMLTGCGSSDGERPQEQDDRDAGSWEASGMESGGSEAPAEEAEPQEKEENDAPEAVQTEEEKPAETRTGLRPEFKAAMDSYEAFYDDYCDLLKRYSEDPSDLEILAEYAEMLEKLADMDEKFAAWESEDLNREELDYYLEVSSRVAQKLLAAAG